MPTLPEALQTAIAHHQAGRPQEAAKIYRQILAVNPRHADAMHLLGVVAHHSGQHADAIRLITEAIRIDGRHGAYYGNLGEACRVAGHLDAAGKWLVEAIKRQPDLAAPYFNLALVHAAQGDQHAAANRCREALTLRPNYAEAHNLLGTSLRALGQTDAARDCFAQAVACNPDCYDALVNLADALIAEKYFAEAEQYLARALSVRPHSADVHVRAGDLKSRQGDWPKAVVFYQKALELDPRNVRAECHWGVALQAQEHVDEAIVHYRRALEIAPDDIETLLGLAASLTLSDAESEAVGHYERVLRIEPRNRSAVSSLAEICEHQGRLDEALAYRDRAIAISPNDGTAHFNRATLCLSRGDFLAGWEEYRWRAKVFRSAAEKIEGPEWDGAEDSERTLLIHGEQGLGDAMQFVRYLPLARRRVPHTTLILNSALVPLLKESGYSGVLGFSDPLPSFDVKISLLDLPRVFRTTVETIPADIPYLSAREDLVRQWGRHLSHVSGYRVGICWQGNPGFLADDARSIPLSAFAAVARVPGVRLVNLQKAFGLEQLEAISDEFDVLDLRPQFDVEDGAFLNAAAVIQNLDLVISADTAIAHLAGALGARVWVALSARSDWRWLHRGDRSPWYPTMRLFRQAKLRDWTELFTRLADELPALVGAAAIGRNDPTSGDSFNR